MMWANRKVFGNLLQPALAAMFLIAVPLSPSVASDQQPPITKEKIFEAWRSRQEKIKTIRCDWSEIQTFSRTTLEKRYGKESVGRDPSVSKFETKFAATRSMLLGEHGEMRHEWHGQFWSALNQKIMPISIQSVFNGRDTEVRFHTKSLDYPMMQINSAKYSSECRTINVSPIFVSVRSLDSLSTGHDWQKAKLEPGGTIDGRSVVRLSYSDSPDFRATLYVDPKRDCVPVRFSLETKGVVDHMTDIEFIEAPVIGWRPSKWKFKSSAKDTLLPTSIEGTVSAFEINQPVDVKSFQIDAPPGAWVNNSVSKAESYILLKQGGRHVVTDAVSESFKSAKDLSAYHSKVMREQSAN